jgi:hypothetical protein
LRLAHSLFEVHELLCSAECRVSQRRKERGKMDHENQPTIAAVRKAIDSGDLKLAERLLRAMTPRSEDSPKGRVLLYRQPQDTLPPAG